MAEEPQQGAQVIDLMDALKASLEKKPAAKRVEAAKPAAKKAAKK
jgi:non-homologous end joining protein Ku